MHWPQATSTLAACGTKWDYQNPFTDGLLCNANQEETKAAITNLPPQGIADNVGVEAQVFTIVNNYDNKYDFAEYLNLIDGPVVNPDPEVKAGQDWTYYTGSRTGSSFGYMVWDSSCC